MSYVTRRACRILFYVFALSPGFATFTQCLQVRECSGPDAGCDTFAQLTYLLYPTTPRFVAVGAAGTVLHSPDGLVWVNASPGGAVLNAVTYGANGFVAGGAGGAILQSDNALAGSWVSRTSGGALEILSLTYGNGRYVAVGGAPVAADLILMSLDGIAWQNASLGLTQSFLRVNYFDTLQQFVATGEAGLFYMSSDGLNWTSQSAAPSQLRADMAYGNGLFLTGDDAAFVYASPTPGALGATGSISAASAEGAAFFAGRFLLSGDTGEMFYTVNGQGAATLATGSMPDVPRDILVGETRVLVVGGAGAILDSTDGLVWNGPVRPTASDLYGGVFARVPTRIAR
jgi:hypothetical protein